MDNNCRNYTPSEIFEIFWELTRLFLLLNYPKEEPGLSPDMTVYDFREYSENPNLEALCDTLNVTFKIDVSLEVWKKAVLPEKSKKFWDMCVLISKYAKKEIIKPVKLFGTESLSVAVFLKLKTNLEKRHVDVTNLRPSMLLNEFRWENMGNLNWLLIEVTLTGTKPFDILKVRSRKDMSFFERWKKSIKFGWHGVSCIDAGDVLTFKDLSKKIAEELLENENNEKM